MEGGERGERRRESRETCRAFLGASGGRGAQETPGRNTGGTPETLKRTQGLTQRHPSRPEGIGSKVSPIIRVLSSCNFMSRFRS
jgi:hypothetical protein